LGLLWLVRQAGQKPDSTLPVKTYTPIQVQQAQRHVEHAKALSRKAETAARKNKRMPFQVVLTEDDLNAYISSDPEMSRKLQHEGFRDVQLDLGEGTATVQGSARMPILDTRIWMKADGTVRAGDRGQIFFEPTKVQFGKLEWGMPPSVKKQITDRIRTQTNRAIFQLPADIEELKVTDGKIVLKGMTNPELLKEMEARKNQPDPTAKSD
jgi:hypothetical protein